MQQICAEERLHKPDSILQDWHDNPKRLVLLVDETRRSIYADHDEIIVFTCVALDAHFALHILEKTQGARTNDQSFKTQDITRPDVNKDLAPIIGVWCRSLQGISDIKYAVTTAKRLKLLSRGSKTRLRLEPDLSASKRPRVIEGRELGVVIHLILKTAIDLQIGNGQVDVILDRSDQIGMAPGKRQLPKGVMEVYGPGRLDMRPNGGQADLKCASLFRLIADSDEGPFRDLLMLPDLYGHLRLKGVSPTELVSFLGTEAVKLLPFDIVRAKQEQRT